MTESGSAWLGRVDDRRLGPSKRASAVIFGLADPGYPFRTSRAYCRALMSHVVVRAREDEVVESAPRGEGVHNSPIIRVPQRPAAGMHVQMHRTRS